MPRLEEMFGLPDATEGPRPYGKLYVRRALMSDDTPFPGLYNVTDDSGYAGNDLTARQVRYVAMQRNLRIVVIADVAEPACSCA